MVSRLAPWRGGRQGSALQPGSYPSAADRWFRDFDEFFGPNNLATLGQAGRGGSLLACDFRETDDQYLLSFDVPGIRKDEIDIDLSGHVLTIRCERREESDGEESGGRMVYRERRSGIFERSFSLPEGIDASGVEATYDNGVLHLMIPKADTAKRHKIAIKEGTGLFGKIKEAIGLDKNKAESGIGEQSH